MTIICQLVAVMLSMMHREGSKIRQKVEETPEWLGCIQPERFFSARGCEV